MRRTGTGVRGRRFAVLLAAVGIAVGAASPAAFGIDAIRPLEWHLDTMRASEIWQTSTGKGVTVAVIDGGVDARHADLVGQVLPGKDFSGQAADGTSNPSDHGTSMAALIAGTGKGLGGKGAFGLAPDAKILPLRVSFKEANGEAVSDAQGLREVDAAIRYAADQGAKVISMSLGSPATRLTQSDLADLKSAVDYATSHGSLLFAAAGNSGNMDNRVEYPAATPGVVGVGAVDHDGKNTAESERGPQVALAAPGIDMYSACVDQSFPYCRGQGTSHATALVSAAAALVWSVHKDWSANQVLRVLLNTAGGPSDGSARNDAIGYGVVRPRVALTTPGDPGPADVSPLAVKSSAAPSGAASDGASAAAPAPGDAASAPKSGSGSLPLVLGGVAVVGLVVVVGAVILVTRRKKPVPVGYQGQPPYYGGGQQPPFPPAGGQQPPSHNPYQQ